MEDARIFPFLGIKEKGNNGLIQPILVVVIQYNIETFNCHCERRRN